jgi:hypothetical protein
MASVNQRLLDAETGHAIELALYSNGVVRRIIGLLNRTDADLFAQLTVALERLPASAFTTDRLEALLGEVRGLNLRAYQQVERELTTELRELAAYEAGYQLQLFQSVIPAQVVATVGLVAVPAETAYVAAMARPFQGKLLREWATKIEADRMVRVRDAIRIGYVEQQTIGQMVQRLRGTRAKGYADGLLEIDRRSAEAVVRTAVGHTAGVARDRFMEVNSDLIAAVQWVSTLDSRTSPACRIRDTLKYKPGTHAPIGHKIPWGSGPGRIHWNCRSCSAPVTKSWRDLGFDIDELSPETRASMDGQVPADQTYNQWLAKQSAKRQDEILGPARGKLLRQGGLTVDKFYNDKGKFLTLDEVRARDAKAFSTAGL